MNNQLLVVLLMILALTYAKKCCNTLEVEKVSSEHPSYSSLKEASGKYKYNKTVKGLFYFVKMSDPTYRMMLPDLTQVIIYTILYLGSLQIREGILRCPLKKVIICLILNFIYMR